MIGEYSKRRSVPPHSFFLAPFENYLENPQSRRGEATNSLHLEEFRGLVFLGIPTHSGQVGKFFSRPLDTPEFDKFCLDSIPQGQEVRCVAGGIINHSRIEWAFRPIRTLKSLVHFDIKRLLEKGSQTNGRFSQELCGHPGIEDVIDLPLIVPVQATKVKIGVMKNDLYRGVFEDKSDPRKVVEGQWVNYGGFVI